ncbi:GNAT family N-acetyltransferase [Sphingobacterium multivorum]|uniref:GNAT family N-acetyltransferase n=1 Tax=Bacteroidota TaxID=976 RepID=UPI0037904185
MKFNIQPTLENEIAILCPLQEKDFEDLYAAASNPKIWEQHPNKDLWKREIFKTFFEGAIQSEGAFKIVDKVTGKIMGSTRYYDFNEQENSIFIGYTFYAVEYWGKGINNSVKNSDFGLYFSVCFQSKFPYRGGQYPLADCNWKNWCREN